MRCAVLPRCAVPRRAVPVPVRLLVLCITVTFRLSVRVSFPLCCGRYVCFSKPLTFHNGSMFFRSSCMVRALFQTSSPTYFTYQEGLEVSKCDWNSNEKQKHMKPLWRVKGFEKQTSWKESVLDCASYWEHEQKEWSRHVHLYVHVNCDLESVFDTDTPHQHTHRTHTTQHNTGKERGTRLFLDSTGGSAEPFSLVCLVNSVNERLSLLESPRSYLYLIAHVHVNVHVHVHVHVHVYVYVLENVHVFGQRDIRTPTSRPTQCTPTATQCTPTPTHCTHHTLRTHRTPSKSISVRTRKMTFS